MENGKKEFWEQNNGTRFLRVWKAVCCRTARTMRRLWIIWRAMRRSLGSRITRNGFESMKGFLLQDRNHFALAVDNLVGNSRTAGEKLK
jgi:hypothetical protein